MDIAREDWREGGKETDVRYVRENIRLHDLQPKRRDAHAHDGPRPVRLVLQADPLDDDTGGKDDEPRPRRLQPGFRLRDPGVRFRVQVQHAITDGAGEQLTQQRPHERRQADRHPDLRGVEVVDGAEGRAAGHGE